MGSNPNTAVIRPWFFKPLMNDYSTKLRLPFVFVKKHRKFLPENAMLRIRTGEIWNVKIEEYYEDGEGLCFFTEGWSDFVRDLKLQNMQMLVFFLNVDEAAFDVTVYEANSNERESSAVDFPIPGSIIELDESESDGEGEECDDESRPRYEFVLSYNRRSRVVLPKNFVMAAGLNGKSGVVLQFEAQERFWPVILKPRTTASLELAEGWKDFRVDNRLVTGMSYSFEFDSVKNLLLVSNICRRSEPSSSSSAVNAEKRWRFVREVKESNISKQMCMPRIFAQCTGIESKESIELENGSGRRWRVHVKNSNAVMLGRGWPDFCRENNLQVGNILLFEFVPNSNKVVKVVVMENEVGKEMLARSNGGMVWF